MLRVIPFPLAEPVPGESTLLCALFSLHDAAAGARRRHRPLIVAAGEWALAHGAPLPADHVALWAAAAEASGRYGDVHGLTGPWRACEIRAFVEETITEWCDAAQCLVPADLPRSLQHLYTFLADDGRLHPGSDPLPDLTAALAGSDIPRWPRPAPIPPPEPTAA